MIKNLEQILDKTMKAFQNAIIELTCTKEQVKILEKEKSTFELKIKSLNDQLCESRYG